MYGDPFSALMPVIPRPDPVAVEAWLDRVTAPWAQRNRWRQTGALAYGTPVCI